MALLDFIFRLKKRKIKVYLRRGAAILDVRDQEEVKKGSIPNSIHIPLKDLKNHENELRELNQPIIVCCEMGGRAAKATEYLNLKNIDAINGGGWKYLKKFL